LVQRYLIEALKKAGMKEKLIASTVGVHPSTICREMRRNIAQRGRTAGRYMASNAQRRCSQCHHDKPKLVKFTEPMKKQAVKWLEVEKWSPELISVEGKRLGTCPISHEWLYQWIWSCKHGNKRSERFYKQLYNELRHGRRRRKRGARRDTRGIITDRVSIEQRPRVLNKRKRPGDVEVDLLMGKNHKGALVVMTDRATLFTRIKKLPNKSSHIVSDAIKRTLRTSICGLHTLTFDNDKAFTDHKSIGITLGADTHFTRPYTSQDKGTVENRIGQLRRFFPKKTDFQIVSHERVKEVERLLNNRPVRKFDYKTPNQVLQEKIALIT